MERPATNEVAEQEPSFRSHLDNPCGPASGLGVPSMLANRVRHSGGLGLPIVREGAQSENACPCRECVPVRSMRTRLAFARTLVPLAVLLIERGLRVRAERLSRKVKARFRRAFGLRPAIGSAERRPPERRTRRTGSELGPDANEIAQDCKAGASQSMTPANRVGRTASFWWFPSRERPRFRDQVSRNQTAERSIVSIWGQTRPGFTTARIDGI